MINQQPQPAQPASIDLQSAAPIGMQPDPQAIQNPAAGVPPVTGVPTIHYAGFWSRTVAALIDGVLMNIVLGIIAVVAVLLKANATIFNLTPWLLSLIAMVYYIFCEASAAQATIGKRIVGIKVTDYSGGRISLGRSVGRTLAKNVSALILFIGFMMAGFTAKKQGLHDMMAKTLVVKYKHSSLGKLLLIMLITLIILIVGGWLLIYDVFIPRFMGSIASVMNNPQKIVEALNNASSSDTTAPVAAFTAVSAAEYQADLKQTLSGFPIEASTATDAGVALLSFDSLFITVDMSPIPNLTYNEAVSITINKILDLKGKNINDVNSDFEKDPFFRKVNMVESNDPVPHYEGDRSLNVLSGSSSSDAKSIQGTLELNLPVGLKTINLTQADVGKPQSVVFNGKAFTLTLKTLDDQSATIDCSSSDDCLGDIQGVDAKGDLVPNEGLNSDTDSTANGAKEYAVNFNGDISGIAVYVPASYFTASYPFTLTVGQNE